ncbi:MAG TPA: DMT family transporter [Dongiaceae bacterium]|nr:DMT family transporter [Dongiaceae bacterium]
MNPAHAGRRGELLATAGLLLTAVGWGSQVPLTTVLLANLPPFLLAAIRYSMAAPVLAILVAIFEQGAVLPINLPWRRIVMLGGFGVAGFGTCYTFGVAYSGPITAAAILATGPVVAALMDWVILRQRISRRSVMPIALTVAGGLLVAFGQTTSGHEGYGGIGLLVLGLVCWTWYSLKAQAWLAPLGIGQLRLTMVTSAAAGLWLWVTFGVTTVIGLQPPPTTWPPVSDFAILAYLIVVPTAICIALWNQGAARLGVTVAMVILNLSPVFSVLLSIAINIEPTTLQLVGGIATLAGVFWLQFGGKPLPRAASVDAAGELR